MSGGDRSLRQQLWRPAAIAGGLLGCVVVAIGFTPTWNFLTWALAGSALIVGWIPSRRPSAGVTAACIAAVALLWATSNPSPFLTLRAHPETLLALGGLGATAATIATRSTERLAIIGAAGIPAFVVVSGFVSIYTWTLLPLTLDAYLFHADLALGLGAPAYVVGRWFEALPLLAAPAWLLYMSLPLAVAVVFGGAASGRIPGLRPERALLLCAATGLVGTVLYCAYPATGPRHAFPGFPVLPTSVPLEPLQVPAGAPRNAMPSLHLTWALLLWRLARGGPRWVRLLTAAWLAGTALSTLGLGEHYAIDLIVALPFALAMEAVWAHRFNGLVAVNAVVVGAWIVGLRLATPPDRTIMWGGTLLTLGVAFALSRVLDRGIAGAQSGRDVLLEEGG